MTMQVDARDVTAIAPGTERDDRARAQKVAAARRQRQFLLNVAIRLVSLTAVLGLWEYFGATMDPGLFTTPLAIAKAAVVMIGSGELWNYLAPSLVVLAFGFTSHFSIRSRAWRWCR
jgi:hypothetical protein